ncbi:hypothetical protein HY839_03075 [Candidatus Azambacteria bacterium]|nr:hypothetical protein [Candidatus Azambacteria bacterium]
MVVAFAFSFASVAFAQVPGQVITPGAIDANQLGNQGTVTSTSALVGKIMDLVNWVAWFVGLMAVLMGLYAGVLFITAAGNAESITKARSILLYAIVGIAVAVLAFSLVAISKSIFTL